MKVPRGCRHCGLPHLTQNCNMPEGKRARGGRSAPAPADFFPKHAGAISPKRSSDNRQQERIDTVLAEIRAAMPKRKPRRRPK